MKKISKKMKIILCISVTALAAVVAALVLTFILQREAKEILGEYGYTVYSVTDIIADDVTSEIPVQAETEVPFNVTSPSKSGITVTEPLFTITGTSNPQKPLLVNGVEVSRIESGEFSFDVTLTAGKNTFAFESDGYTVIYTVNYKFTVIKAYAPYEKQTYEAGSGFVATVCARVNSSSVTAAFNGQTVNLLPQPHNDDDEFINFSGTFTLPGGNDTDLNLGKIKFTAVCDGLTESYNSADIICLRDTALDRTQIVEIITEQAETFDGNTTDNASRPTNSYLPKGTVDYKVGGIVYDADSGNSYYNLRCGKRVYIDKKDPPNTSRTAVSTIYQGELPEYNNLTLGEISQSGNHTYFTFNTEWKAPFAVEIGPQNYTNPQTRDYSVTAITYGYVDIKFFYSQSINGSFDLGDNPLFGSAEIIPAADGYTLRLYLNSIGAFYGWNAEYNADGQLVFEFLNPPKVNGVNDLTGLKIVIDVGHGGIDTGALGLRPDVNPEKERNLNLALYLKSQLESYGATVIISRTSDVAESADARCNFLRRQGADLCISIHHDSSTSSSANGGSIFCFNAFSDKATKCVFDRTLAGNFYNVTNKGWHYFYLARVTSCPVVLTENGFISNPTDFVGITDENVNVLKARAITDGILDYFNAFVQ